MYEVGKQWIVFNHQLQANSELTFIEILFKILTRLKISLFAIVFCSYFSSILMAQDLHFSQYYRTPIMLNPANTGAFEEDIRMMAIARNQWATIPVNYNSIGASFDMNFPFKVTKDKFGLGLQIMGDRAGDSKFTTFQATGSGAYHLVTSGLNFMILSIGANVNFIQRSYNPDLLRFPEQFNGDYFDPSLPVTEQFDRLSLNFFDFGLGLNYQQTFLDQHVLSFGASVQHLLSSEQNFLRQSSNALLQKKWNLYLNGDISLGKGFSIIPLLFYQHQDEKYEIVTGGGLGFHLTPKSNERNKMKLGLVYRIDDALIPWVQYEYKRSSVQLSYDYNNSPLSIASNSYGGLELSYGYLIYTREKRERYYDFCPFLWF